MSEFMDAHMNNQKVDSSNWGKSISNAKDSWEVSRFKQITSELLDTYIKKNADYGGSFDKSLDEDGLLVAKIRLMDKMNRFNSLIKNPAQVEDESLEDTLLDLANYAIMSAMWLRIQEPSIVVGYNFKEDK